MFLRSRSCWAFMGTSSFIWSIIRLATEVSPSWQGSFLSWCSGISNTLATTSIILFKAELEERFLPAEMTALFTNSPGPSHPNWTRLGLSAPYPIREHFTILWVWLESGALYPLFTEEPYFADPLPTVLCYSDSSTHTDKSEKNQLFHLYEQLLFKGWHIVYTCTADVRQHLQFEEQLQNEINFAWIQPCLKCCHTFPPNQSPFFSSDSCSGMNKDSTEYFESYIEFFSLNLKWH